MSEIDKINVCIPVISAIIERIHDGELEILVQTRWKPERDPEYSGSLGRAFERNLRFSPLMNFKKKEARHLNE